MVATFERFACPEVASLLEESGAREHDMRREARKLQIDVDTTGTGEGYELTGTSGGVTVKGSLRGVRYGLETLRQLTAAAPAGGFRLPESFEISDAPAKPHRGVMVDTGRNFLPVPVLKRIIRGMGMSKLNKLHLHLTDTAAFPLEVANHTFHQDAEPGEVYTLVQLQDLVEYGKLHAVDLIPEVDAPAHVNAGWPRDMIVCGNAQDAANWQENAKEPIPGQLNIADERVYTMLEDVYKHLHTAFGADTLHLGGDEVFPKCWSGSGVRSLLEQGSTRRTDMEMSSMWAGFTKRALELAKKAGFKQFLQWGGVDGLSLLQRDDLHDVLPPKDVSVMVWDDLGESSAARSLTKQGYGVVLGNANHLYLDCGTGGWVGPGGTWCKPYHEWYDQYDFSSTARPLFDDEQWSRVHGAQVYAWGETADQWNLEVRLWPRAAALAESLWSAPAGGWRDAYPRMVRFRDLLSQAGIPSTALAPAKCAQIGPYTCLANPPSKQLLDF